MADNDLQVKKQLLHARYINAIDKLKEARNAVDSFKARFADEYTRNRLNPKFMELNYINSITDIEANLQPTLKLLNEIDIDMKKTPDLVATFSLENIRNNLIGNLEVVLKEFMDFYNTVVKAAAQMTRDLYKIKTTATGEYNLQVPYVHAIIIKVAERINSMGEKSLTFRYAYVNVNETKEGYNELRKLGNKVKDQILSVLRIDKYGR